MRPLNESDFAEGDAILRDVYLGEGYSDVASAPGLAMAQRASTGVWLGAYTDDGFLAGVTLVIDYGSRAAVVAEEGGSEIRLLAVAPRARRSGAGRALVLEAERIASIAGAKTMTFSTQSSMIAAHRLYRSLDYQRLQVADYEVGNRSFIVFHKRLE